MRNSKKWNIAATGFIIGGTVGSIATFLFTPKTGKELRGNIQTGFNEYTGKAVEGGRKFLDGAGKTFDEVIRKADQLRSLSGNYLSGAYTGPKDRIQTEIASLRRALTAAITAYRRSPGRTSTNDTVVDNIYSEFDDETLPKYEGMGRRNENQ